MIKGIHPFEACLKKKVYSSKDEAESAGAMQEILELNKKLAVYSCPKCNKWHLTHKTEKGILEL